MPLSGKSCSVRGRIGIEWSAGLRYDVLADLLKAAMISVCESRKWGRRVLFEWLESRVMIEEAKMNQ